MIHVARRIANICHSELAAGHSCRHDMKESLSFERALI